MFEFWIKLNRLSFFLLAITLLNACQEEAETTEVNNNEEFLIKEHAPTYDSFKETSDLLNETNRILDLMVGFRVHSESDSTIKKKYSEIFQLYFMSNIMIEDIDTMLSFLSNGDVPHKDNFSVQNTRIDDYNDVVSNVLLLSTEIESQVILQSFDYTEFKLSPKHYLMQKRMMIAVSNNYLLIDLLRESLRIELNIEITK